MISFVKAWILQYGIFVVAVAALAGWSAFGVQTIRLSKAERDEAIIRSNWDADLNRYAQSAARMSEANRAEENRRNEAVRKAVENEAIKTKAAKADADAAGGALERLRKRLAATSSCSGAASNSSDSNAGDAAAPTGDMRSDVLGRVGEAAGQLAAYADSARIAGEACQVSYQGLVK